MPADHPHALQLDAVLAALADGDHALADAVAGMTPDELAGHAGAVDKAMSTLTLADGGALVRPPGFPGKRRRKKVKRAVARILKGL